MRDTIGVQQNSPLKELIADGNRRKPPISNTALAAAAAVAVADNKDNTSEQSASARPLSTASSDGHNMLDDDIDDIDDDITTTASESYAPDDSSTNEGNSLPSNCVSSLVCLEYLVASVFSVSLLLRSLRNGNEILCLYFFSKIDELLILCWLNSENEYLIISVRALDGDWQILDYERM